MGLETDWAAWLVGWLARCLPRYHDNQTSTRHHYRRRRHSHTKCSTFCLFLSWSFVLSFFFHAVSYLLYSVIEFHLVFFHLYFVFVARFSFSFCYYSISCLIFFIVVVLVLFFLYIFLYLCVVLCIILPHLYDHPGVPLFIPNGRYVISL